MGKVAKNEVVRLEYSADGETGWVNVPGVRSFDPGTFTSEDVDVTDYDSPDDQREYENGFKAASDGSIVLNFDEEDPTQAALMAAAGGAAVYFRHQYDTRWMVMRTLIKSFPPPSTSIGEALIATATVKAASAPVWEDVTP